MCIHEKEAHYATHYAYNRSKLFHKTALLSQVFLFYEQEAWKDDAHPFTKHTNTWQTLLPSRCTNNKH